jgi:hypothetical protein
VLEERPRRPVPAGAIPTSAQVPGPASDAAAICGVHSVQSVSPSPTHEGHHDGPEVAPIEIPNSSGMATFGRDFLKGQ